MAKQRSSGSELRVAVSGLLAPVSRLYPAKRTVPRLMLLDGSRGLAAIAVLLYHYTFLTAFDDRPDLLAGHQPLRSVFGLFYEFGHFGVQLFWMISGFVFAAVYYGRTATTREFVVNRFARLYPLHLLTLIGIAALQFALIARYGAHVRFPTFDLPHFLLQLAFASNWLDRFQLSFNDPIWSVSVEVVIYAVFWATRRHLPAAGIAGPLALAAIMLHLHRTVGQSQVFACGAHFFLGVALCGTWRAFAQLPRTLMMLAGVAIVLSLGGLSAGAGEGFVPVLFGGLVLLLVAAEDFAPAVLRRALGALGDRTYSIYLVHAPIRLVLYLAVGPRLAELALQPWFLAVYLAVVFAVAWPCYGWIEAPARDRLRRYARAARPAGAVSAGAAA